MAATFYERRRNLGLAGGCLWLIVVGTTYAAWSLLAVRSTLATALLMAMCICAAGLTLFGIAMICGVLQAPFADSVLPSSGRKIMRQFGMIFAAEGGAIAVVCVACVESHHWIFIVPLSLIIVGLHFLPLARLFGVPRYYTRGALFCAIPIGTMLSVSASAHLGHALSWITIPDVGCTLVCLATAWAGLNEVRQFMSASREKLNRTR
jgi:hypothetical protein